MLITRFYLLLKLFVLFIALVMGEYLCCGVYFRLVRHSDFIRVDWICGIGAIVFCYLIFRNLIKSALKEHIPFIMVLGFFLVFSFLLGCFLRFSLQLANGLLDNSEPETHVVSVLYKNISSFGGSVQEGVNPVAHLVYFKDWDGTDELCELLTPPNFYYGVDDGSLVQLSLRRGFFHLPWVEDFEVPNSHLPPQGK